jgi:hypothetical protein
MKNKHQQTWLNKLKWSLPWLMRYPAWRVGERLRRLSSHDGTKHLLIAVSNHFEPGWTAHSGVLADRHTQLKRVASWKRTAKQTGDAVRDHNGQPFQHTNFFPGEQYDRALLDELADLQAQGYGEVEVHWHHGVKAPDTSANFRAVITEFRDRLAEEHGCLSKFFIGDIPRYGFVHGNFALANSRGGDYCCGVNDEMQILLETGCYADFTLPSFPWPSQVPQINSIYTCGHPLNQAAPHRSGPSLKVGETPPLPVMVDGPLVMDWSRRKNGLPVPRVEDGVLTSNCTFTRERLDLWSNANICVDGRPEWVFIKLYCHGFFPGDEEATLGATARRFWTNVLEEAERTGEFKLHFVSTREMFNIALAATDGHSGNPGQYRDYKLRQIMSLATHQQNTLRAAVA